VNTAGSFKPGPDPRRRAGRAPSGRSIASAIRCSIGRDAEAICRQVQALARAGDPAAVAAAAVLLAAVVDSREVAAQAVATPA
jgi:hypothetical protein